MPFSRTNQWLRNARLSAFRVTAISWTSRGCISATCIRVILSTQLNISTGRGGTWPIAGWLSPPSGVHPVLALPAAPWCCPAAFFLFCRAGRVSPVTSFHQCGTTKASLFRRKNAVITVKPLQRRRLLGGRTAWPVTWLSHPAVSLWRQLPPHRPLTMFLRARHWRVSPPSGPR